MLKGRAWTLTVTARHCEVPEHLREWVAHKVEKAARYVSGVTGAHLVVARERSRYLAELVLTAKHLQLVAKAEAMDPFSAADEAVARVLQQGRKTHARRQDRHLRAAHAWAPLRKTGPKTVEGP